MSNDNGRSVFKRAGEWHDKRNSAEKSAGKYGTQAEAAQASKAHLQAQGGGELTIMGEKGRIRSKDTIAPGKDPASIRDTEH